MPSTGTDWVSIYTAIINTIAIGGLSVIYIAWIRSLKDQIEYWKSQSVEAVRRLDQALRNEIAALEKRAEEERERFEAEKQSFLHPSVLTEDETNKRLILAYDDMITTPPSARASKVLGEIIIRPEPIGSQARVGTPRVVVKEPTAKLKDGKGTEKVSSTEKH